MPKANKKLLISKCNLAQPRFKEKHLFEIQSMISQEFSEEIGKLIRRKLDCPSVYADYLNTEIIPQFNRMADSSIVYHYYKIYVDSGFYKKNKNTLEKSDSTGVIGINRSVVTQLVEIFYGGEISSAAKSNETTSINEDKKSDPAAADENLPDTQENKTSEKDEKQTSENDSENGDPNLADEKNTDSNSEKEEAKISSSGSGKQRLGQAYFLLSRGEKQLSNMLAQLILEAWMQIWQTKAKIKMEMLRLPEGADISVKKERTLYSNFILLQTQKDLEKIKLGGISIHAPMSALYPIAVSRSKHGVDQPEPKSEYEWQTYMQNNLCITKVEVSAILSQLQVALGKVMALHHGDIIPVKLKENVLVRAAKHELCKAKIGVDHAHLALEVLEMIEPTEAET